MKIVVGYDGSDSAKRALERAAALAGEQDELIVVAAAEIHARPFLTEGARLDPSEIHERSRNLEEAQDLLARRGIEAETVLAQGDPGDVLAETAKQRDADLITVGKRGLSPLAQILLGSVSSKVVHRAECDVLVVR